MSYIYVFLGGILIGKITNWIPSIIISGITIFFLEPNLYTYETLTYLKGNTTLLLDFIKINY